VQVKWYCHEIFAYMNSAGVYLFIYYLLFVYCDRPLYHWTKPMRLFVLEFPWSDVVDVKKSVSSNLQSKWNSFANYSIFSSSASQTYQLLPFLTVKFMFFAWSLTLYVIRNYFFPPSIVHVLKSSRMRWTRPHNFGTTFANKNLYIMSYL